MANLNNNNDNNKDNKPGISKEDKEALRSTDIFKNSFFNYDFSNIKRHNPIETNSNSEKVPHQKTVSEKTVIIDDENAEKDISVKSEENFEEKTEISKKGSASDKEKDNSSNKVDHLSNSIKSEGSKSSAIEEKDDDYIEDLSYQDDEDEEDEIEELDNESEDEEELSDKNQAQLVPKEELDKLKDSYLRLKADFENYKKNNKEVAGKMYNEGKIETLIKIFPVLDSFDLGLASADESAKKGMTAIYKQFTEILAKMNVKAIDETFVDFDPKIHDAVMSVEDSENSGKVVEILKKGYRLNDKILRYAMVKVAQ